MYVCAQGVVETPYYLAAVLGVDPSETAGAVSGKTGRGYMTSTASMSMAPAAANNNNNTYSRSNKSLPGEGSQEAVGPAAAGALSLCGPDGVVVAPPKAEAAAGPGGVVTGLGVSYSALRDKLMRAGQAAADAAQATAFKAGEDWMSTVYGPAEEEGEGGSSGGAKEPGSTSTGGAGGLGLPFFRDPVVMTTEERTRMKKWLNEAAVRIGDQLPKRMALHDIDQSKLMWKPQRMGSLPSQGADMIMFVLYESQAIDKNGGEMGDALRKLKKVKSTTLRG